MEHDSITTSMIYVMSIITYPDNNMSLLGIKSQHRNIAMGEENFETNYNLNNK